MEATGGANPSYLPGKNIIRQNRNEKKQFRKIKFNDVLSELLEKLVDN